jgi:hypothetical protein
LNRETLHQAQKIIVIVKKKRKIYFSNSISKKKMSGLIPSSGSIEWDTPQNAQAEMKPTETPECGMHKAKIVKKTFRGVAHRVLTEFGFIAPENLAEVVKFFEEHGGKWRTEAREIFFHHSRVTGFAVAKGDALEFELSADPRGRFGEKNVMAVAVRGGSLDVVNRASALIAKLEKDRLTDKALFEKLEKQVSEEKVANQAVLDQLQAKVRKLEAEVMACKHYAVKVGALEQKMALMEKSLADQVTVSVRAGMASLVEECHRKVFEEARAGLAVDHSEARCSEEFEDPLSESDDSEELVGRSKRGKKLRRKQRGKMTNHNQSSGVFGMLRSRFGLGLLVTLLVMFVQIALLVGNVPECEAVNLDSGRYEFSEKAFEGRDVVISADGVFGDKNDELGSCGSESIKLVKPIDVHDDAYYDFCELDVFLPCDECISDKKALEYYDFDSGSVVLEPGGILRDFDRSVESESKAKSLRLRKKKIKNRGGRRKKQENTEQKQKEEERKKQEGGGNREERKEISTLRSKKESMIDY